MPIMGLGPRSSMTRRTASEWMDFKVLLRLAGGRVPLERNGSTIGWYLVRRVFFILRGPGSEVRRGKEQWSG